MPGLDSALLVQRNSVSENFDETPVAREVLRELFNEARRRAEDIEEAGEYEPPPFGSRLRLLAPMLAPLALQELGGGKLPPGGLEAVEVDFATFGENGPVCRYDRESNAILVNEEHPIVAMLSERGDAARQLRQVLAEIVAGTLVAGGYLRARGVDGGLVM